MTKNQIEYQKHVETGRHNLATEQETHRSNVANELETHRHSYATEQETGRHNLATEKQARKELRENKRSHKVNEKLGFSTLAEQARHNMATENQAATNAEINKYLGELGAATSVATANISASAAKYAAELSAAASKYASDTSHNNTIVNNLTKESQAIADRIQRGKFKDIDKDLKLLQMKLDAAKVKGDISIGMYNAFSRSVTELLKSTNTKGR